MNDITSQPLSSFFFKKVNSIAGPGLELKWGRKKSFVIASSIDPWNGFSMQRLQNGFLNNLEKNI